MAEKEGLLLLCAAVIEKAHQDYVTGPQIGLKSIEKFIRSDLFTLYSMGINPDPDTVLRIWAKERSEYRCQVYMNMQQTGAQKN